MQPGRGADPAPADLPATVGWNRMGAGASRPRKLRVPLRETSGVLPRARHGRPRRGDGRLLHPARDGPPAEAFDAVADVGAALLPTTIISGPDRVGLLRGAREREVRDGCVGIRVELNQ